MKPIWVLDDDPSIRLGLEQALVREQFSVCTFCSPGEVMKALDAGAPQVLVSDLCMSGHSGIDLLAEVKRRHPGLPMIVMTAFSDLDSAVSAFRRGAFDCLPKPFDLGTAIDLVRRAVDESLREEGGEAPPARAAVMLGQAPAMQEVFRAICRLSQSKVTVMITGECGTGKELVARALHKHSPRAQGPFIAVHTAALAEDLRHSERFGPACGGFSGAQPACRDRFEQADGGTLFLDEIGDMPFELQTRLLRVLSGGPCCRGGGRPPLRADVRIIVATQQNLEDRVRQGAFREDLFQRLNVIRLRLPALRERREDIPMLTRFFLGKSARELGVQAKRISDVALERLAGFDFPGNVRQLEQLCHWLTVMAPAQQVEARHLPPEVKAALEPVPAPAYGAAGHPGAHDPASPSEPVAAWVSELQRQARRRLEFGEREVWDTLTRQFEACLIHAALDLTRGRRIEAAQRLGIGRNTITRKIQGLGMDGCMPCQWMSGCTTGTATSRPTTARAKK
jgi:two-component system nitrogen regulation response regulator GlnG